MKFKFKNNGVTMEYPQLRKIVIYGGGKILYTVNNGYFEESRITTDNKITNVYDGRPECVTLSEEPKRARKENLERKDNYTLTYHGDYSWNSGIALYIHESEISVIPEGEYIAFQNSGETNYKKAVTLTFAQPVKMRRCKLEEVPNAGEHFTPPTGCRWSKDYSRNPESPNYDIVYTKPWDNTSETRVIKRWIEEEYTSALLVQCEGYSRTEKDTDRQRREDLAKLINEKHIFHKDISHYEIENLLKYFNLEVKEGVTI